MPAAHWTHCNNLPGNQLNVLAVKQPDFRHLVVLITCPLVDMRLNKEGHEYALLGLRSREA